MNISPTERLRSLDRQVADGLTRLYDYQHDDGGWGWWKTDQNHPFMTAYAVDGLLKARDAGSTVEQYRIENGARALTELWAKYPRALPDLKAYEAYVLARAGAPGFNLDAALSELWDARGRMSTTGQAFLLMTLDGRKAARQSGNGAAPATNADASDPRGDTLARELLTAARTQGDVSSWPVAADALLEDVADTTVEATALALEALSARGTQDLTLERAARWLMANRNSGSYWVSTKQTAMALEGLLAFMKARGEKPAPVVADVLVNGTRVATARFDAASLLAPNPTLIEAPAAEGVNTVRITKQGEGAVYFDAGVRYYDPPASAERTGTRRLALLREYFSLTPVQVNGRIVYRESAFSGSATPGDIILVRLTIAGSTDWRYLMLEDPLPAGAESIEKEAPYELEKRRTWDYGSQRELRDDRTVYFLDNLAGGRHEFSYMLKVTTPGQFKAMPAHVSPMYVPDVSASSDVMALTVSSEGVR
jgi:alpha-2-macroglobulin